MADLIHREPHERAVVGAVEVDVRGMAVEHPVDGLALGVVLVHGLERRAALAFIVHVEGVAGAEGRVGVELFEALEAVAEQLSAVRCIAQLHGEVGRLMGDVRG